MSEPIPAPHSKNPPGLISWKVRDALLRAGMRNVRIGGPIAFYTDPNGAECCLEFTPQAHIGIAVTNFASMSDLGVAWLGETLLAGPEAYDQLMEFLNPASNGEQDDEDREK